MFCPVKASRLERRGTRFADFWNASIPKLLVRALGDIELGATTDVQWGWCAWVNAQVTDLWHRYWSITCRGCKRWGHSNEEKAQTAHPARRWELISSRKLRDVPADHARDGGTAITVSAWSSGR